MAISLEWQDQYNIGVAEIDFQHKYFLTLVNRQNEYLKKGIDLSYYKRLLRELSYYATFHFCSEENLMVYAKYPGLKVHQGLHRDLIDTLTDRVNALSDLNRDVEALLDFLLGWFLDHTVNEDAKISAFLKSNIHTQI